MKKNFTPSFSTALEIAEKYQLNTQAINDALDEIPDFRVTAPVIGGFSTGKSSLINAVIGEKLLSTNITPETAVPTEITSGSDTVTLVDSNGAETTIPLSEFDSSELAADKYSVVKIGTSNEFFSQIPSIRLVDMPGFDSGIEVHNKAIDNYLPKSLAYILTVAADEGTLRQSIITFLNELKLYDMPVYTVITKSGKVEQETIDSLKAHLSETISRFLKIDHPKIAVTNAKRDINTDEFRSFLLELQDNSDDIFNASFAARLDRACYDIEKYLADCLDKKDMSLMDLQLQKEQAQQALTELNRRFEDEKARFGQQIQNCISTIKSKISDDLNASCSTIASMLLQGQESAVSEKINTIIRNAVASGIQSELEPKIKKYIRNVEEMIQVSTYGNTQVRLPESTIKRDAEVKNAMVDAAKTAIPMIAAVIVGTINPILGVVVGLVGSLVGALIGSGFDKKQEQQKQELAKQKAHEIINSAIADTSGKVEAEIISYTDSINEQLAEEIRKESELKTKALADCEEKLRLGTAEREQENAALSADLETIRGIRNGI